MEPIKLWHVHSFTGTCHGYGKTYEVAYVVAMQLYIECGKTESFFVTQERNARLNTRPLPNSWDNMTNNEAILAAKLDALTIAITKNTQAQNETLEQRYGPKPEQTTLCEQALYSYANGHGNMVHRCNRPKNNHQAHTTSMYGTPINWYSA